MIYLQRIAAREVDIFRERGWLVLPGVLGGDELAALRADMERLTRQAHPGLEDFLFGAGHLDGSEVLRRIQYVVDKSPAARATVHVEWEHGPYTREYVVAKQKVLRACIRERRQMRYAAGETSFEYRPPAEQDKGRLAAGEQLATYRYAAADYRLEADANSDSGTALRPNPGNSARKAAPACARGEI